MRMILCISVRFLHNHCHARANGLDLEWPPSPLRIFQALVAAAAGRWNERIHLKYAAPALHWLEQRAMPSVVAAKGIPCKVPYRLYIPDNVADKVTSAWSRGTDSASIADYRSEKDVRAMRLEDNAGLHYLFPIPSGDTEFERHREILVAAARSITHLGWGVDMVAGDAAVISEEEASALPGERWLPIEGADGAVSLRVPIAGTLDDLARRHAAFLNRLVRNKKGKESFRPVPPPSAFRVVGYRRSFDPAPQPFAVFQVLAPNGRAYRPFDAARRATTVAGMVRHALAEVARLQRPFGWNDSDINTIIQGHAGDRRGPLTRADPDEPRFGYLPLPSIERRGNRGRYVGMIRRVIVVGRPGMTDEIAWVRGALSGAELAEEHTGDVKALLSLMPETDWVARQYWEPSSEWATVTPVVVPGFDDRSSRKTERLLRKALVQAGFPADLAEQAELAWRAVGFLPGLELAREYRRPSNIHEAPVRHVSIRWRDAQGQAIRVAGPLAVGSGRFRGLGLFASAGS